MKIRIKENSVRFRLTKTEVETFSKKGLVRETTKFPNKTFSYTLKAKSGIANLEADFLDDTITLYFPERLQKEWATNNKVGYANTIYLNENTSLSLLVEKDFTCLDNTIEDQSDNYPNPKLSS